MHDKVKGLDEKLDRLIGLMATNDVFEDVSNPGAENSEDKDKANWVSDSDSKWTYLSKTNNIHLYMPSL